MDHHAENELSHRQEREQQKEEHKRPVQGRYLSAVHPAWYVVVGVITIGAAVLVWTFIVW